MKLDPKKVKEYFDYRDGHLYWKERSLSDFKSERLRDVWNSRFAGKRAGGINPSGYVRVSITYRGKCRSYMAHRLIWAWHYDEWPKKDIDHIDHNPSNNRIENIRSVTRAQNQRNRRLNKNNTSGVPGVYFNQGTKMWQAKVGRKHLGEYRSFKKAVRVREDAAFRLGYHPNHGKLT